MRNLKKVLGLVLCLAMMLSIMVVGAGAVFADQKDIDTKHQEAVDACSTLNIITGFENGKFMPNDNVTREQMAKMICVLDNGGKEPQLAAGNTFTDVPSDRWSNKYIEACAARGVVVGIGGGKFSPAGKVTATQAAKMLLVELGYNDQTQNYSGANWATQVNIDATKKGYYKDLEDIDVNAPLTREHAAQMIWNALQAVEVEYSNNLSTDGQGNLSATPTAKDKLNPAETQSMIDDKMADGYMSLIEDKFGTSVVNHYVAFAGHNSKGFFDNYYSKLKKDPTEFVGTVVKVLAKDYNDVYGIYIDPEYTTTVVETTLGDIDLNKAEYKLNGETYKVKSGNFGSVEAISVTGEKFDNNAATLSAVANASIGNVSPAAKVVLIDNTGDEKIDVAVVTPVKFGEISYLTSSKISVKATPAVLTNVDLEDCTIYDGAAKDDYVGVVPAKYVALGNNTITKLDKVSGEIDATKGTSPNFTDIRVDGTWYTITQTDTVLPVATKDSGDFYLFNNYVVMKDTSSGSISDTCYVIFASSSMDTDGNMQAKVMLNGETKVIPYKNNTGANGVSSGAKDVYATYEIDDGVYTFTKIVDKSANNDKDSVKGFIYNAVQAYKDKKIYKTYDSTNQTVSDGFSIDGDAVFYVKYKGDKYECVTGETVANWGKNIKAFSSHSSSDGTNTNIVLTKSTDGMNVIKGGAIDLGTMSLPSSNATYGVIVSKIVVNKDGQKEFTLWNGEEYVEITTTKSTATLNRYDLVEYQANTDDTYTVTQRAAASSPSAITGYNKTSGDINFNNAANSGTPVSKLITKDTKLIFVNTDPDVAVEDSGILGESVAVSAQPVAGTYNTNVLYYDDDNSDTDLTVLVVDTANNVYAGGSSVATTYNVNVTGAAKALFSATATPETVAANGTVTLTLNGIQSPAEGDRGTYTISVTGADMASAASEGSGSTPVISSDKKSTSVTVGNTEFYGKTITFNNVKGDVTITITKAS